TEELPEGTAFGHAAAMIQGGAGRPRAKIEALREVGALVAQDFDDLLQYLSLQFRNAPYFGHELPSV
ncbi:MAG: hypothetical protein IRY97_11185, partial [Thermomicrobiaceae bacterium]|nr:hypothetical protein [Thermomicrobiaceae bacterium]